MSDDARLAFLSVVRRGLAALVDNVAAVDERVGAQVSFSVDGTPAVGLPPVALRGPGDVVGFDGTVVRRTWPAPGGPPRSWVRWSRPIPRPRSR